MQSMQNGVLSNARFIYCLFFVALARFEGTLYPLTAPYTTLSALDDTVTNTAENVNNPTRWAVVSRPNKGYGYLRIHVSMAA